MTRTTTIPIGLVLAAVLLAACTQRPAPRGPEAAPVAPPAGTASPQAGSSTHLAPAAAPQGTAQWTKPDGTNVEYRADLESCFGFAQARIAHDERIEADTRAAFDATPGSGFGVSELSRRMSAFERRNRRAILYRECMRDKGYVEQQ